MYDLDAIHLMNEQAHLAAVERARGITSTKDSQSLAPVYPLAILAKRLIVAPPSISGLIDLILNSDVVTEFRELVREFLPEHESFIMAHDEAGRIREFTYYFNRQYFPLSDNLGFDDLALADLVRAIPVDMMGFSYEDYHEFGEFRPGFVLMLSLAEAPYYDDSGGGRVPILERVSELVGRDLAELIPQEGWPTEDLHRMLDKTDYEGVALFADWVHANTGCRQLDANYEEYGEEAWTHEVVDTLTAQWPRVRTIQDTIHDMYERLETDIHHNLRELLSFMLGRKDLIIPKEQIPLPLDDKGHVIVKEVPTDGAN